MTKVELIDDEIWCMTDVYYPAFFRSLSGRWDKDKKMWHFKPTLEVCRLLRKQFGPELAIGPKLNEWAWAARKAEDELKELIKSDAATLKIAETHGVLAEAMSHRTYQQVGAAFIAMQRRALIADEPGLGKTLEAIAGLIEAQCWHGMILVAAPLTSLRPVWERELAKFAPDAHTVIAVPRKRDSAFARLAILGDFVEHYIDNPGTPHVLVINPDMLRKDKFPILTAVEWQAIIVDESHRSLTGIKSARNMTQMGKGLMQIKLAKDGVKIALSGTPMRGKAKNLWGTLHWLSPEQYTSFFGWAERYFIMSANRYSSHVVGDLNPYRENELYKSLDGIMLRRTKAEVVKELPPKQRVEVYCDMSDAQQKMYTQMANEAIAELVDMEDEALSAIGVLAIMTRLKQFADCAWRVAGSNQIALMSPAHSGKAAVIEEMLIDRGIAGPMDDRQGDHKIVIASQFTQVIDSLEAWLKSIDVATLKITGAVSENKRTDITEQWQSEGGPRVLLMNTMAGGVAITLDAYCDELVIIDETWTPDDQEQLEDRIHRVSRIHQVTIFRLLSKESIDEYIAGVTYKKDMIQKEILDGRRGIDNIIQAITPTDI